MSAAHDGGPAFPMQEPQAIHAYALGKVEGVEGTDERDRVYMRARAEAVGGMSLRDYFAAKAMRSLMADSGWRTDHMEATARLSYQMADAMLKERK